MLRRFRVLVVSAVVTAVVLGFGLIVGVTGRAVGGRGVAPERPDYLATSTDRCVTCHRRSTPGIVEQYASSSMAAAKVTCGDCHIVPAGYPGSIAHEGANVLRAPTTARCQRCHQPETEQYMHSRHSLPAYVAYVGPAALTPEQRPLYDAVPEGRAFDAVRSELFDIEGPRITRFACIECHSIGAPREDGSVGRCEKCHLRHEFSLAQSRKPETCNACHIGPDHPQWEIYQESPHGILYATQGDRWHWQARPGTLTPIDMPAPTCATCHMSGFGSSSTTHDVGDRLTWFLFSPVSDRRPSWQDNRTRMQSVCFSCHSGAFVRDFYQAADVATEQVNDWVKQSQEIMRPLVEQGLVTKKPFDEPIDFEAFEVWHHWGRTAKFGVWMQGPDYTQWHGAYEVIKSLSSLDAMAKEKLAAAAARGGK